MMRKSTCRLLALTLITALILIPLSVALAKGPPEQVTISGPGIDGEITIADSKVLNAFSFYQFNDLTRMLDEPPQVQGEGYKITRWVTQRRQGKHQLFPWDYLTYYPDPAGGPGYLYFDGLDRSIGSTEGQGEWFLASEEGGRAMKEIIASQTAAPTSSVSAAPVAIPMMAALVSLIVGSAVVMAMRARRDHRDAMPA
jgi:hypothetical protein